MNLHTNKRRRAHIDLGNTRFISVNLTLILEGVVC